MIRIRVIFDLLELPIKVSNGTEIISEALSHIDFNLEQFLLFLLLRFHKEKNMKRRNKIVLLILLVFTFIPVSGFAAETTSGRFKKLRLESSDGSDCSGGKPR